MLYTTQFHFLVQASSPESLPSSCPVFTDLTVFWEGVDEDEVCFLLGKFGVVAVLVDVLTEVGFVEVLGFVAFLTALCTVLTAAGFVKVLGVDLLAVLAEGFVFNPSQQYPTDCDGFLRRGGTGSELYEVDFEVDDDGVVHDFDFDDAFEDDFDVVNLRGDDLRGDDFVDFDDVPLTWHFC